jgi:hypothetical protein
MGEDYAEIEDKPQTLQFDVNREPILKSGERWYEDNNLGVNGSVPLDFISRMSIPDAWKDARDIMDVYYLRSATYTKYLKDNNSALKELARLLNKHNIVMALDDTAATWAHSPIKNKDTTFQASIRMINHLKLSGFDVRYIGLQSVLSKPLRDKHGEIIIYNMEERYKDVSAYLDVIKSQFPELEIGIIDALPAHVSQAQYQQDYQELVSYLTAKNLHIDYIHLDVPMNVIKNGVNNLNSQSLVSARDYIKNNMKLKFGLILTDQKGGVSGSELFLNNVIEGLDNFIKAGGNADAYVLSAWYPYPNYTVPDSLLQSDITALSIFRHIDQRLNFFGDFNHKHCIYDVRRTLTQTGTDYQYPGHGVENELGEVVFRSACFSKPDLKPLYHCASNTGEVFISGNENCEQKISYSSSLVGYVNKQQQPEGNVIYRCTFDNQQQITTFLKNCKNDFIIDIIGYEI